MSWKGQISEVKSNIKLQKINMCLNFKIEMLFFKMIKNNSKLQHKFNIVVLAVYLLVQINTTILFINIKWFNWMMNEFLIEVVMLTQD